ncbi:MAG: MlaE family lipid ABC transporter permease subunit [Gammaproteobacteria bacterium]|nr:MlaE family lipid ABC transporter permease subunit [Gammaproteobacteria bacterium]MCW5583244.1 MlaE family lipid ABC transporter permease subunit [Gammaproteobacteria bacterium]
MTAQNAVQYDSSTRQLSLHGDLNLRNLAYFQKLLTNITWPNSGEVIIDGERSKKIDTAGAWLLVRLKKNLKQKGIHVELSKFSAESTELLAIIDKELAEEKPLPKVKKLNFFALIGLNTIQQLKIFQSYLSFVGHLTYEALRITFQPARWRWNSLASVIYQTGYQGLPIIALLSFLIGVVLTYQMGLLLRNYGANIYIVDLLGLSVLREFAPLITAIMVSGRTGSSYTASIGMMKLNQEIDALDTLGVTPAELLLLPRILGLLITLPLLVMWSDIFGIVGGMVMSNNMLGITWHDFLDRFPQVIPLRSLIIGIGKAPVFALIISSIGCFQGMQVKNSADSVGQNTTKSVVLAIFFIIVADAIFSIIFSKMKL